MFEIIIDTILDVLKLIPFLLVSFLLMEYVEHNLKNKTSILKSKKIGPLCGSIFGAVPQCGFSVLATNLFSNRIITIGTLIAIYLSTSDEMVPILISNKVEFKFILSILLIKVIIGIIVGYVIDFIFNKKDLKSKKNMENKLQFKICQIDKCDCKHGIFKSSLIHTGKICIYILLITFLINIMIFYIGESTISSFLSNNIYGPFLSSLIGLIPNCASSVIITQLYISGMINVGMLIAGLLTGSGVALLVLFKVNKNLKENILIISLIYFIGAIVGLFLNLINFSI